KKELELFHQDSLEPLFIDPVDTVICDLPVGYYPNDEGAEAFELKADKFKPDHLGQLNFYLEALDRDVKKTNENPSLGILLCKDKDSEVVEYALSRSLSPTMVAEYKTQLPDKKLLQQKLHELFDNETEVKQNNLDQ
ncbi:MAG TPA: PDDEXK nuclease domain-containing protein, partial [Chitinophagales bacterium]|nr:PDDEXK nuclease domain-containing protein [Chitinophagales bacterium]